tara:strand:+ start:10742 stop:13198 length:2457 start_codon:yes stop_codon:yes gene_type:complete
MSSSFQSTAFKSSANPVDTFVAPPQYQPISDIEVLSNILSDINPTLQKFLYKKMEKAAKEERRKGARKALDESKLGFKNVTKDIRKTDGNKAANQLIGGSIFANDEYQKVKTQLISDDFSYQVQGLYNDKKYTITTEDNKEIQVPITHFPVNSPEFQDFLSETSTIAGNLTQGLNEDYVIDNFYPKQSEITEKIVTEHIKKHNTYKFNRLKKQSFAIITSAYGDYRAGNKDTGINKINDFIDNKVLLGITQDNENKFFDALLNYTLSLRDEAYTVDGLEGSKNVLEMMRGIKYGPNGASIFETHPKFLSEMHKQTIKHIKDQDAIDKIDSKNKQEKVETGILLLVNELGNKEGDLPYATIQRIRQFGVSNGVDVDWIDEKIDIFVPERQQVLKDFSFELTEGTYLGRPLEAAKAWGKILNSLGPLTDNEEAINNIIKSQIESSRKGQTDGGQQEVKAIIQRLRKQANPSYDSLTQIWKEIKDGKDPTEFMLNLERKLNRDYKEYVFFTDDNNDGKFDKRSAKDIFEWLKNAEDDAVSKIKKWQGGSDNNNDNNSITLPSKIFKTLSGNDAYEQITIDGQTAYKDKKSGEIYISDEVVVEEGGDNTALDPLNKTKRKNIKKEDYEPGFFSGDSPTTVTVEKGDTLFGLADQFSTTVQAIKDANGLDSDLLKIGQELIMPISKNKSVLEEIDITKPFTYNSLYRLALEVGFPPKDARIAAAIALAESSGRAGIDTVQSGLDRNKENEFSLGLWQIDMQDTPGYMVGKERRPQFGIESNEELYDPLINAKAAKVLYDRAGGKFTDWATFKSGKYKKFLPKN